MNFLKFMRGCNFLTQNEFCVLINLFEQDVVLFSELIKINDLMEYYIIKYSTVHMIPIVEKIKENKKYMKHKLKPLKSKNKKNRMRKKKYETVDEFINIFNAFFDFLIQINCYLSNVDIKYFNDYNVKPLYSAYNYYMKVYYTLLIDIDSNINDIIIAHTDYDMKSILFKQIIKIVMGLSDNHDCGCNASCECNCYCGPNYYEKLLYYLNTFVFLESNKLDETLKSGNAKEIINCGTNTYISVDGFIFSEKLKNDFVNARKKFITTHNE